MARPSMSAKTTAKKVSKSDKEARIAIEDKLRGKADKLEPLMELDNGQRYIFDFIVGELEECGILSNLDVIVITECAVCIDGMMQIEKEMRKTSELKFDKSLLTAKSLYARDFQRYCNELCLSPQSRAKIANINLMSKQESKNPLLEILGGDDE